MQRKTGYTAAPPAEAQAIAEAHVVSDFLPRPEQLALKEDNVKVTLDLSRRSVRLFKRYAGKRGLKYQRMIRNLVDGYAEKALNDQS
jgi:predicted DNA binding CopG/RHH family protein